MICLIWYHALDVLIITQLNWLLAHNQKHSFEISQNQLFINQYEDHLLDMSFFIIYSCQGLDQVENLHDHESSNLVTVDSTNLILSTLE